MVLFLVAIMSFIWRSGAVDDPDPRPPLSVKAALGPRIAVTGVFALGMIYFIMIVKTLRSYGGPRIRESIWRVGSASNNGGSVTGVGGLHAERDQNGDGDTRRGRERERVLRGGNGQRERVRVREIVENDGNEKRRDDSGREGETGNEKPPSGLRKGWGVDVADENMRTNEPLGAPGSSQDGNLEKEGMSEKVSGSNDG
jgi:hypothetical protein